MSVCIHDLPAVMCADCRPAPAAVATAAPAGPPRRRVTRRPLRQPGRHRLPAGVHATGPRRARHRGQCARCGQPYAPGALIKHDEATDGWIAECCADGQEEQR